jgi:hypothetical protein
MAKDLLQSKNCVSTIILSNLYHVVSQQEIQYSHIVSYTTIAKCSLR